MRVISWNLLRLEGAAVDDVAALLERERPDVLLMQEVTQHMDLLATRMPGHYHRLPWPGRIHGLAVWSRHNFATPHILPLPASPLPGRLPQRRSQIVQVGDITFANVHLSHGQLLNRRQLMRIAGALRGKPSAIIGDYNAVGPNLIPGFADVGPREANAPGSVTMQINMQTPQEVDAAMARAAAAGATVTMPPTDTFWVMRYGRLKDPYGYVWSFSAPLPL